MVSVERVVKPLSFFLISLPLTFVLLFFGFLSPKYDAVVYTDSIVGEGACSTYLASDDECFSYLYSADTYFGSELKTLKLRDIRYNVDEITLSIFGVEKADIVSFEIALFGIVITHASGDGLSHPFSPVTSKAVISTDNPLVHIEAEDPSEGTRIILGGFDFIPLWFWIGYWSLLVAISVLFSIALSLIAERLKKLRPFLLSISGVVVVMLAGCFFCGSLPYVDYTDFLLNWLFLFAAALFISALTLPWVGTVTVMGFTLVWYIANYFVILFRNKPIMPADLTAIGTAAEVVNGYSFAPTWQMVLGVLVVVLYAVGVILVYRKDKQTLQVPFLKKSLLSRAACALTAVLLVVIGINTPAFASLNSFAWDARVLEAFHREGMVLTFVNNALHSVVREPEGYSMAAVEEYLSEYQAAAQEEPKGTQPTNIIMVMDEAFADLRTVGLSEEIDVMPFIDSLDENIVTGDLGVSIYGGGTCNTEFEALTGNSLAFLGAGSYPYTSYLNDALFSLASYFKNMGYGTEAFHANNATNWNRNRAYPNMGFEQFHSIDDYPELTEETTLHGYPADSGDFQYMESIAESYEDKPRFLFNVTIQNHSGYEHWEDVKRAETVEEHGQGLYEDAQIYLSLVKASDDAVKQLVETYRDSNEPTMIVFFGDHQPGLVSAAQEGIYTDVDSALDYYKTKFFIWTNYDTPEKHDIQISANYLPYLILEQGNFPLPPYVQMLKEVAAKYPVITTQGVIDAEGNEYSSVSDLADDPLIRKYQYVQYANMFDEIDGAWFSSK